MTTTPTDHELHAAVRRLGLHGVLARWEEIRHAQWLPLLVDYEQTERQHRSLERRLRCARLGRFKPLCDFDWQWPKKIDRMAIDELGALEFLAEAANVVLIGPQRHRQNHDRATPRPSCAARWTPRALHHCQRHAQ